MPNKLPSIQYSPPWAKGGGECKKPSERRPVSAVPHTPSLDSFGSAFIRNYLVSSSSSLKPFTKYFLSAVSLSFLTRLLPLRQIWASYTSPIWKKKKKSIRFKSRQSTSTKRPLRRKRVSFNHSLQPNSTNWLTQTDLFYTCYFLPPPKRDPMKMNMCKRVCSFDRLRKISLHMHQ